MFTNADSLITFIQQICCLLYIQKRNMIKPKADEHPNTRSRIAQVGNPLPSDAIKITVKCILKSHFSNLSYPIQQFKNIFFCNLVTPKYIIEASITKDYVTQELKSELTILSL